MYTQVTSLPWLLLLTTLPTPGQHEFNFWLSAERQIPGIAQMYVAAHKTRGLPRKGA